MEDFLKMRQDYYALRGWSPEWVPKPWSLRGLPHVPQQMTSQEWPETRLT
jgi:hypothetical protein